MNIIEAWMDRAKEKHGSISAGVRFLNMICNMKLQPGAIYKMRDGKQAVPACIQRIMLNEVLLTEIQNAKVNIDPIDFQNFARLRDRLSLPLRVKK